MYGLLNMHYAVQSSHLHPLHARLPCLEEGTGLLTYGHSKPLCAKLSGHPE